MDWGPDQIDRVRTLAADGLSAAEIAREIGGVSRQAVAGVVKRRGIALAGGKATGRAKPRLPPLQSEPEPVAGEPVSTLRLKSGQCKWPVSEDSPWLHCGLPAHGPYCREHHARSYSKSHRDVPR